jgi:hypothetical protein
LQTVCGLLFLGMTDRCEEGDSPNSSFNTSNTGAGPFFLGYVPEVLPGSGARLYRTARETAFVAPIAKIFAGRVQGRWGALSRRRPEGRRIAAAQGSTAGISYQMTLGPRAACERVPRYEYSTATGLLTLASSLDFSPFVCGAPCVHNPRQEISLHQ